MCTHRQLPPHHAVYGLTVPHFEKTLALNILARSTLVGTIVDISGVTKEGVEKLIRRYYYEYYDFTRAFVPNDLKSRGFLSEQPYDFQKMLKELYNTTPGYYYGFMSLLLWDAIRTFAGTVLRKYYKGGDSEIRADQYLQNWANEIKSKEVKGFPCPITSMEQLTDAVSGIIYNGSVLHSAVNYLQWYYMGYVPMIPSNICGPLPTADTKIDEFYLASHLPTYYQEEVTRAISGTLSSPTEMPLVSLGEDYLPDYAKEPLKVFKNRLYDIHLWSTGRDKYLTKLGRQPYPILDPDQVAASIQI
jgi:hypothetical protein